MRSSLTVGAGGGTESGGGAAIDFWKVQLNGGDQLVIDLNASVSGTSYRFELYAPGTTDETFSGSSLAPPVDAVTNATTTPDQLTLQAPYTGLFVLAVCQFGNGGSYLSQDCRDADPPGGAPPTGVAQAPMLPYMFTTSDNAVSPADALLESRAGQTIAAAPSSPSLSAGAFGGGAAIDFWKVQLNGGDQLGIDMSAFVSGTAYRFELYAPGTTDATFSVAGSAPPVDAATNATTTPDQLTLQAPYTGLFVLAVCQFGNGGSYLSQDCRDADPPGGAPPTGVAQAPMLPYTFSTSVTGIGDPTSSTVVCAPATVQAGSPTTCTAAVTDTSSTGASTPTGAVSFTSSPTKGTFGSARSCTLHASGPSATASCSVRFTPSAGGRYTIAGSYSGDSTHSASQGAGSFTATTSRTNGLLVIDGRANVSRKGVAAVKVSCSGDAGVTCVGKLALTTTVKAKAKRRVRGHLRTVTETKTITLGSVRYRLTAHSAKALELKLSRAGVKLLRKAADHEIKAKASAKPPTGSGITKTVTLVEIVAEHERAEVKRRVQAPNKTKP